MKYFYISSLTGNSGVSKYAAVFYERVLKPAGYIYMDCHENLTTLFTTISSADHVHIEIGIFQVKEMEILNYMLNAGYKNIYITLHDAPLLKYPMKRFGNPLLNRVSKFYDRYISRFSNASKLISRIKTVYVLTEKGLNESEKIYNTGNFKYLPHIVDLRSTVNAETAPNRNFLYLGFIGKNKGIEYALKLHEKLIRKNPDIIFYVVGTALGTQKEYYHFLKSRYTQNVRFMGYVYDEELLRIYQITRFAFLLFRDYRFFYPASGSILNCMSHEKIILTNRVNTIPEMVTDGKNGLFLAGKLNRDLKTMEALFDNERLQQSILENTRAYLEKEHNASVVSKHFFGNTLKPVSADSYL